MLPAEDQNCLSLTKEEKLACGVALLAAFLGSGLYYAFPGAEESRARPAAQTPPKQNQGVPAPVDPEEGPVAPGVVLG